MSTTPTRRRVARGPNRPATIAEAAEYGTVSMRTIHRRIYDGTLPSWKVGPRMVRVDLDDVDRMFRPVPAAGSGDAA